MPDSEQESAQLHLDLGGDYDRSQAAFTINYLVDEVARLRVELAKLQQSGESNG